MLGFRRRVGGLGIGNAIAGLFTAGMLIAGFATAAAAGDPIKLGDAKTQGTGIDSITIGNGAITPSMNSIAIGTNARASWCCDQWADSPGDDRASIAIGADARSYDDDGVALGRSALTGDGMLRATAIGARAQATAMDALALGAGAKAQFLGGVALGSNSVSDTHGVDTKEVIINGTKYDFAGATSYSTVSIGNATTKRQLTNLAAGQLNAASTDGVNGSQLFATNSAVGTLGDRVTKTETRITANEGNITNISTGKAGLVQQAAPGANITIAKDLDGAAIDITGTMAAGTKGPRRLIGVADGAVNQTSMEAVNGSQLNKTDTRVTNLYDSIAKTIGIDIVTNKAAGLFEPPAFEIQGNAFTSVGSALGGVDSQFTIHSNAIKGLNDVAVKYVWNDTNKNGAIESDEVDLKRVVLAGKDGTTVSNVANGAVANASSDAVNGSQLFGVSKKFATYLGGGAGVDANGALTAPKFDIASIGVDGKSVSNSYDNVGAALGGLNSSVSNINTHVGTVEGTINTFVNNITAGKVGLVQQDSNTANLTVGKDTDGAAVDLNGKSAPRKLLGLATGNVTVTSTEGVNGSQLFDVSKNVSAYLGGKADTLNGTAPSYDIANIDRYGVVTPATTYRDVGSALGGLNTNIANVNTRVGDITSQIGGLTSDALLWNSGASQFSAKHGGNGPNIIGDVAEGKAGTDAVNVSQLKVAQQSGSEAVRSLGDRSLQYVWDDKDKDGVVDTGEVDYTKAKLIGGSDSFGNAVGTKISNLAKGTVTVDSLDAVNGSQLYGAGKSVATIFGGGAGVDANGNLTEPTYTIQTKEVHTVEDALEGLDGQVTTNTANINKIDLSINGLKDDALQWDPAAQVFSAKHLTETTNKIANVKAGTDDTDAVNFGQLKGLGTAGTEAVIRVRWIIRRQS